MSTTMSAIILFGFFFGLPAVLTAVEFLRHAHETVGEQRWMFLRLLGRICIGAIVIFAIRLAVLSVLYGLATDGNTVEALAWTLWTALPEVVWLFYRVEAMLHEMSLASGMYRERVVMSYLSRYSRWITRCHAFIATAVVLSMVVVAIVIWGDFDGGDLERGPVGWTVAAGLCMGTLMSVLLTKTTEPVMAPLDPTGEAGQPLVPEDASAVAGRAEVDDAIRDWRSRR